MFLGLWAQWYVDHIWLDPYSTGLHPVCHPGSLLLLPRRTPGQPGAAHPPHQPSATFSSWNPPCTMRVSRDWSWWIWNRWSLRLAMEQSTWLVMMTLLWISSFQSSPYWSSSSTWAGSGREYIRGGHMTWSMWSELAQQFYGYRTTPESHPINKTPHSIYHICSASLHGSLWYNGKHWKYQKNYIAPSKINILI